MNGYLLDEARIGLSCFVEAQAAGAAKRLGFGWRPDPAAPDTYDGLRRAFGLSRSTGLPLPVAAAVGIDRSVFVSAEVVWAMRFWDFVGHVELASDFGHGGRQQVAGVQLSALEATGRPVSSLEWRLLQAATIGRNLVAALAGGSVVPDQWAFAQRALNRGLPMAVLEAVEAIQGRQVGPADVGRLRRLVGAS